MFNVKHDMKVITLVLGLAVGLSSVMSVGLARPKPKRVAISSALSGLKWGESHHEVVKFLKEMVRARYKKDIRGAVDAIKADRLRKEMKAELDRIMDDYVEFTGQRTGYSVSFIKDDFAQNNGETLLKFDEGSRTRYFFFRYDQLWKIVVSYPVQGGMKFEDFYGQVKGKFGRPKTVEWDTPHGGSSTWSVRFGKMTELSSLLKIKVAFMDAS